MINKISAKEIRKLYDKYVKDKFFYRTFSKEYLAKIKKEGFNPLQNPYELQKNNILYFCRMLDKLEKKGFNYVYPHWPGSKPIASLISRVFRKSLRKRYIDLTPNNFDDLKYYERRRGGDIPQTIYHIINDLKKWNYPLTNKDNKIMKRLLKWSIYKMKFDNFTVKIKATSHYLESAHFQAFKDKKYIPSPFGSIDNFSRTLNKYGSKLYLPYLKGKEPFYLRFQNKIPAKEIIFTR